MRIFLLSLLILFTTACASQKLANHKGEHIENLTSKLGTPDHVMAYQDGYIYTWGHITNHNFESSGFGSVSITPSGCIMDVSTDKDGIIQKTLVRGLGATICLANPFLN
jgi:hypothetical protein